MHRFATGMIFGHVTCFRASRKNRSYLFRKNDITSKIGKRLVKSSNTGIAEIQNLMEIIYHPKSIRRLCFYLFSKTEDTNQRSEISEWIRNQPRTVEIEGESSTNTKEYSITFKSDKDLTGTFSIFESYYVASHAVHSEYDSF